MIKFLKTYLPALIFLSVGMSLSGQSIPIQLMVVDQDGFEKVNTPVKLRLTMRNDTLSTTGQYVEVHTTNTNDLGIVSIQFGEGIPTSNTKVLGLDGFTFSQSEPYIRTELDTTISPSNYVSLGWMKYSYPVVAQRALKADTADYLRNYIPNDDNDSTNELQSLSVTSGGYLKLSKSSDSIFFDPENQVPNDDINFPILDEIPQSLDGQKLIYFSTSYGIYVTDSIGSFLDRIYKSDDGCEIKSLCSNTNSDTLYFLRRSGSARNIAIFSLSLNDLNVTVRCVLPLTDDRVKRIKYRDGELYILEHSGDYEIHKLTRANDWSMLPGGNSFAMTFTGAGDLIRSYWTGGGTNFLQNGSSSAIGISSIPEEMDYSTLENRVYIRSLDRLWYYDFNTNSEQNILSSRLTPYGSGGSVVDAVYNIKYDNGRIYYNSGASLLATNSSGTQNKLIIGSPDGNINGIVCARYKYINSSQTPLSNFDLDVFLASQQKKIFFSTEKSIYLTDSAGNFLINIYTVDNDRIMSLCSNTSGDTLFFIQSSSRGYALSSIMMMTLNDLNVTYKTTIPSDYDYIERLKFVNGDFYILGHQEDEIFKLSSSNQWSMLPGGNSRAMTFTNTGSLIRAYYSNGGSVNWLQNGTSSASNLNNPPEDMDFSYSENRVYLRSQYVLWYYDFDTNGQQNILSNGLIPTGLSTDVKHYNVKYHNGLVYYNSGGSLLSIDSSGNNNKCLTGSIDATNITGIAIIE